MLVFRMNVSVLVLISLGTLVGKMHMLMYACVYNANDVISLAAFLPILLIESISFS